MQADFQLAQALKQANLPVVGMLSDLIGRKVEILLSWSPANESWQPRIATTITGATIAQWPSTGMYGIVSLTFDRTVLGDLELVFAYYHKEDWVFCLQDTAPLKRIMKIFLLQPFERFAGKLQIVTQEHLQSLA